jgi:hypothetical protein
MQTQLKKSIFVIAALVLCLIIAHIDRALNMPNVQLSVLNNFVTLAITIIYFVQLNYNLNTYLKLNDLRMYIIGYIIVYVFMYLTADIMIVLSHTDAMLDTPKIKKGLLAVTALAAVLSMIAVFVIDILFALKLRNKANSPEVRLYGFAVFLAMCTSLIAFIIAIIGVDKITAQLTIIFEVFPLWCVYRIYRKLLLEEFTIVEVQ